MKSGWIVMVALAVGTYTLKSAGPLLLGNRRLPTWFESIVNRLPAALLAALVVTSAFASKGRLVLDPRAVGLAAAVLALSRSRVHHRGHRGRSHHRRRSAARNDLAASGAA